MLSKVLSGAVSGINGYIVNVEVDISRGLPCFEIVGLPGSAVKESRERVRTAVKNSGCEFPPNRITVNLAPADTKKGRPGLRSSHSGRRPFLTEQDRFRKIQ